MKYSKSILFQNDLKKDIVYSFEVEEEEKSQISTIATKCSREKTNNIWMSEAREKEL